MAGYTVMERKDAVLDYFRAQLGIYMDMDQALLDKCVSTYTKVTESAKFLKTDHSVSVFRCNGTSYKFLEEASRQILERTESLNRLAAMQFERNLHKPGVGYLVLLPKQQELIAYLDKVSGLCDQIETAKDLSKTGVIEILASQEPAAA